MTICLKLPTPFKIERIWLTCGRAFALLWLRLGALTIGTLLLPVLRLCSNSQQQFVSRAQLLLGGGCRFYLSCLSALGLAKLEFVNFDKLTRDKPVLIIANHPSLLDVILILAAVPQVTLVAKAELWNKIWLRPILNASAAIKNSPDRDPYSFLESCKSTLLGGNSLLIFPEGTRSPPGGLGKFQRSAAAIALSANCPILPILIEITPPVLGKAQKWYQGCNVRTLLRLRLLETIDINRQQLNPQMARRRCTRQLEKLFEENVLNGKDGGSRSRPKRVDSQDS